MAFNWQQFLDRNNIEYQSSGANVSKGHVSIHCPMCGADDPSFHMSVNLEGRGWRCWRNPSHRGVAPARLVAALLGISIQRAHEMIGGTVFVPDDFMARIEKSLAPKGEPIKQPDLRLPDDFRSFTTRYLPSERPYRKYLRGDDRGFRNADISEMTDEYGMYYCCDGPYRGRVIFTVREKRKLISWTGRAISRNATLRYKTLSTDEEKAKAEGYRPARKAISHCLLWQDQLMRWDRDILLLVEGPFDALKINILGKRYGIAATCFFTSAPTEEQIENLHMLCPQFSRRILLLDRGTLAIGMRILGGLSGLDVELGKLPKGLKDPGELTTTSFQQLRLALDL